MSGRVEKQEKQREEVVARALFYETLRGPSCFRAKRSRGNVLDLIRHRRPGHGRASSMKKDASYQPLPTFHPSNSSQPRSSSSLLQTPIRRFGLGLLATFLILSFWTSSSKARPSRIEIEERDDCRMLYKFEPVQGFFAQSDSKTSPDGYDVVSCLRDDRSRRSVEVMWLIVVSGGKSVWKGGVELVGI